MDDKYDEKKKLIKIEGRKLTELKNINKQKYTETRDGPSNEMDAFSVLICDVRTLHVINSGKWIVDVST